MAAVMEAGNKFVSGPAVSKTLSNHERPRKHQSPFLTDYDGRDI